MNDLSTKIKSTSTTTVMDTNRNNNNSNRPLKRTRAKRSCDFCRKRKARCDADNTIPCTNCKAVTYLSTQIMLFLISLPL